MRTFGCTLRNACKREFNFRSVPHPEYSVYAIVCVMPCVGLIAFRQLMITGFGDQRRRRGVQPVQTGEH